MRSVQFDSFDSELSLQVWYLPASTRANGQKQLSYFVFCWRHFLLLAKAAGGKLVQTTVTVESCTVGLSLLDLLKEDISFLVFLLWFNKIRNTVFGLFDWLLRNCILFLTYVGCLLLVGLGVFHVLGITATVISFGLVTHSTFRYLTHKEVIVIRETKRRAQLVLKTIWWHVCCVQYSGRLRGNLFSEVIIMASRLLLV
jgi:hypothetical protein